MLTREDLARFAPRPNQDKSPRMAAVWDGYVAALVNDGPRLFAEHGVDEALEFQHFMAQIGHECGGFTILWESGAYTADGIMRIFGEGRHSAAVTRDEAQRIAAIPSINDQRAMVLFERVYGVAGNPRKAHDLGNRQIGDGYRYRGFGPQQITGRADHERLLCGDYSPTSALRASLQEFVEKGCLKLALRDDIEAITRKINGGTNGLEDREAMLARAKRIWPIFPCSLPPSRPIGGNGAMASAMPGIAVMGGMGATVAAPVLAAGYARSQGASPADYRDPPSDQGHDDPPADDNDADSDADDTGGKKSIYESKTAQASGGSALTSVYTLQAETKRQIAAAKGPAGFEWGTFLISMATNEIFLAAVVTLALAIYVIVKRKQKKDIK